jgi:putative oxidoreductase
MNFSENFVAGLGRLLIAVLFFASGINKLLNPTDTQAYMTAAGVPKAEILYWVVCAIEVIGSVALALGLARRLSAFVLAVFTLLAAAVFHTRFGDAAQVTQIMQNDQFVHFMKNLAIAGGLLQIAAGATRTSA